MYEIASGWGGHVYYETTYKLELPFLNFKTEDISKAIYWCNFDVDSYYGQLATGLALLVRVLVMPNRSREEKEQPY